MVNVSSFEKISYSRLHHCDQNKLFLELENMVITYKVIVLISM